MRKSLAAQFIMLSVAAVLTAACGNPVGSSSKNITADSAACVDCHSKTHQYSTVTGGNIVDEWKMSKHYGRNAAGCNDCHQTNPQHGGESTCASCHGGGAAPPIVSENCKKCHVDGSSPPKPLGSKHLPELNSNFGATTTYSASAGWANSSNPPTALNTTAGWVALRGTQYESKCIWCHNPHDNRVLPQHIQWAESGHGETTAGYTRIDMKARGTSTEYSMTAGESCVRCHTSTGFINWVNSGFKDVSAWGKNIPDYSISTAAKTKQTIYCIVCHDNGDGKSYSYRLRTIPAFGSGGGQRIYYNYSAAVSSSATENGSETFARIRIVNNYTDYPNIGVSDRCLLCHSGRGSGVLIKQASITSDSNGNLFNFRKNNRIGTHDFAGAGTMFRKLGFEFYSTYHYDLPSNVPYKHDQIGQNNYMNTGNKGPCVSCHLSGSESHSFMPVTHDDTSVTSIDTSICSKCHSSGGVGNLFFDNTASKLSDKKAGYAAAINVLKVWLTKKQITSTSNWLRKATFSNVSSIYDQNSCVPPSDKSLDVYLGSRNMGSSMNLDYLSNDPGGYIHNDLYVKRLLYDTVDWIDNCKMDNSVDAAIDMAATAAFASKSTATTALTAIEVTNAKGYLSTSTGRPGGL